MLVETLLQLTVIGRGDNRSNMIARAFFCLLVVFVVLHTAHSTNKPPKILKPDKRSTVDVFENADHTLQCSAEATSAPRFRWTFNGSAVPDSVIVDNNNGDLKITKFKDSHEGNYQCFVESEISPENVAVAMSAVTTLRKIKQTPRWPPSSHPDVNGTEGLYVKLTCDNPPESVPAAQYSWYLSHGKSPGGQIKASDRMYIDEEGSLHFVYLKTEDQSEDKRYKCGSYNTKLSMIKLGSEKHLNILSSNVSVIKPRNRFHTNSAKFLITREAVLECVFSGNPIPMITWRDRYGKETTGDDKYRVENNGHKLIVKDLKEEDEGNYTCKGSNDQGSHEAHVSLNVTAGPIWVEYLQSQTVPENKDAAFSCRARPAIGERELNPPKWFKNGAPLPLSDTEKFQFSDNARILTVKNSNKTTDIMCFQCEVSNDIGYELGDGCLNVIDPIEITTQPELEQRVAKGDIVNLTVVGKTDPDYTLEYRWYFRNATYNSTSLDSLPLKLVIFSETTKQAYINTSGLSDEEYRSINGTYIRELYHPDDKLNVSIVVIFQEEPPITVTVVAAGVDLWWIALIVALIILIIVIILIGVIIKRKNQEGHYPLGRKEREHNIDVEKDLVDASFQKAARISDDEDDAPPAPSRDVSLDYGDDMGSTKGDEASLLSSGEEDMADFNEDGSFIGGYGGKLSVH